MSAFQTKLIINISITLIILSALSVAIFKVGLDIESNALAVFKLNQDLNSRSSTLSEITKLRKAAVDIEPYFAKLKMALPNEDGLIGLSNNLSLTAKHYELGYGFKFGAASDVSTGLKSISFDMNLQGTYQSILKFLDSIKTTNGQFINISNIDIVEQGDRYTATLNGLIYYNG